MRKVKFILIYFFSKNKKTVRLFLAWIALLSILIFLGRETVLLDTNPEIRLNDFSAFWSAARLSMTGNNPYDPELLLPLQKEIGRKKPEPERSWNPPWTLFFIMPFSLLKYPLAAKLWLIINLGIVFICVDWLWRFYGGPLHYRWIAWIIGMLFFPTIYVLQLGQISAIVFLGIIGFLHFINRENGWMAGIFAVFVAIKPHLVCLFWLALIFWVIKRQYWEVLLGMGMGACLATTTLLALNPDLISQYIQANKDAPNYLLKWPTPTFGTAFRALLGMDKASLQYVPSLLGLIWLVLYLNKHHKAWEWGDKMPVLLLVSFLTSFYSWGYDQVVLLVAVVQAGVVIFSRARPWPKFWAISSFMGINFLPCGLEFIFPKINAFSFILMAPLLLVWYWLVRKQVHARPFNQALESKNPG